MSKDNNLKLLGSPVNLSFRNKKNNCSRPRSALQYSCFHLNHQDRYKRPFSADTRERADTASTYRDLKTFPAFPVSIIKVLPPTTDILRDRKANIKSPKNCSNASDYGSEDTHISLGTKIKAKAQHIEKDLPTHKNSNCMSNRRIRKLMDKKANKDKNDNENEYNVDVTIAEKFQQPRTSSPCRSDPTGQRAFEAFFLGLDSSTNENEDSLAGRVSFGNSKINSEIEVVDTYSRRLNDTKQKLSLVEEESVHDDGISSPKNMPSLPPDQKDETVGNEATSNTFRLDFKYDEYLKSQNIVNEPRVNSRFCENFQANSTDPYNSKRSMPSNVSHTDSSSKDSGYLESGTKFEKHKQNYSLPSTSTIKKSSSYDTIQHQPMSFESISTKSEDRNHKTFPRDKKNQWAEPLNHSRLLYKDFFLKKEGHIALPPQNSPRNSNVRSSEAKIDAHSYSNKEDYPSYLCNSTTKAYTSKVIEDYKRELETINNLHELNLKDIKTDAVSPTPLYIDRMFVENTQISDNKRNEGVMIQEITTKETHDIKDKNLDRSKRDISKVSSKELIQNYFKVKECDYLPKSNMKSDKKLTNNVYHTKKQEWNNNAVFNEPSKTVNIKNQSQKNLFTIRTPTSARLEDVQTDKDIDSWMSLSAPSPTIMSKETENLNLPRPVPDIRENNDLEETSKNDERICPSSSSAPLPKESSKDFDSNASVLDIYSMLKEIESYGENPVATVSSLKEDDVVEAKEEVPPCPKENFMEIFEYLEKVEQSASDALAVITTTTPQTVPKLEMLLKLPHTELAQRLVTASLQLEERSCCITLLQESLNSHKEQMISKVSNLEKASIRNVNKVKQECEETVKRHQNFIDQLINDKKTLNHRIEQLVDERRSLEERWKRAVQTLEERYKLELRNQHDKMAAAQQVARQRWVRQKAEKIKELTVKGLEGELREMADRQQKEVADLKMLHAEQCGKMQAKHAVELEEQRRRLDEEREAALVKERQLASSRMEKQILELELTYQEQRTRLVAEMRAENERVAANLSARERAHTMDMEKWKEEQEALLMDKKSKMEQQIAEQQAQLEQKLSEREQMLVQKFEQYKKEFEAEQNLVLKKKVAEISAQHKQERDREIEKAIESMEAEAQAGRKDLQDALRRNKEQYEAELYALGETEKATLRRYQEAQARVRQTEDMYAELEVSVSQLETRNRVLTEKNSRLESEAGELRAKCDTAWRAKLDGLQQEIDMLKKTHDEQMHQLYAKVKVAVARKDSTIQALTREAAKYQEKITLLEQKLQQQRKDFLKHK